jgi:hypothetical protein
MNIRSRVRESLALVRSLMAEEVLVYRLSRAHGHLPEMPFSLNVFSTGEALPATAPYAAADRSRYLGDGWRLYALMRERVPVSFGWMRVSAQHDVVEVRAKVRMPYPVGWIIDCVTPEIHRGNRYYPKLISGITASCDADTCYIYCVRANNSSKRGIESAGFERLGTIRRRFAGLYSDCRFESVTSAILHNQ